MGSSCIASRAAALIPEYLFTRCCASRIVRLSGPRIGCCEVISRVTQAISGKSVAFARHRVFRCAGHWVYSRCGMSFRTRIHCHIIFSWMLIGDRTRSFPLWASLVGRGSTQSLGNQRTPVIAHFMSTLAFSYLSQLEVLAAYFASTPSSGAHRYNQIGLNAEDQLLKIHPFEARRRARWLLLQTARNHFSSCNGLLAIRTQCARIVTFNWFYWCARLAWGRRIGQLACPR